MRKYLNGRSTRLTWVGKSPGTETRVALLIPQYNEFSNVDFESRLHYFKGVADEYRGRIDLVIIDDGSTDESLPKLKDFLQRNSDAFYVASVTPNANKVGALFLATLSISHEFVLLSDFDTDIKDLGNVFLQIPILEGDASFMGGYFRMLPFEGSGRVFLFQQLEYTLHRCLYRFHRKDMSIRVMPGAGSCYKRDILLSIYMQHSGLRSGEDREATLLGLKSGYKALYMTNILALTRPPQSFKSLVTQRIRWNLGYLETLYKEKGYYLDQIRRGRRLGLITIMDMLTVAIILLMPVAAISTAWLNILYPVALLVLFSLVQIVWCTYLLATMPRESHEFKGRRVGSVLAYPFLKFYVDYFAWMGAFAKFLSDKRHWKKPTSESTPFIGQVEYLRHLLHPMANRTPPCVSIELRIKNIDIGALEKSLMYFVERHESLRTSFYLSNNEVKQIIMPYEKNVFGLRIAEMCESEEQFKKSHAAIYEDTLSMFAELNGAPLVRCCIFPLKDDQYYFSFFIHHIICDAWSVSIIKKELFDIYTTYASGKNPQLTPLTLQLKDYSHRQNAWFHENKEQLGIFWRSKLNGFDEMFDIERYYSGFTRRTGVPLQGQKPMKFDSREAFTAVLNEQEGAIFSIRTGNDTFIRIRNFAQRSRCSVSAVVYASFFIYIFQFTRKSKILLAALIADRSLPEYRHLIGNLLGGAYLPREITEDLNIGELLRGIFHDIGECVQNIIYNHDMLGIDGHAVRTQCELYMNYIVSRDYLDPVDFQNERRHRRDTDVYYPVNCMVNEYANDLCIEWRYNCGLFPPRLIEDMVSCHEDILDSIVESRYGSVGELLRGLRSPKFSY